MQAFPECRSGKCARFIYPANEAEKGFCPKGCTPPANDRMFIREYVRFGPDFQLAWRHKWIWIDGINGGGGPPTIMVHTRVNAPLFDGEGTFIQIGFGSTENNECFKTQPGLWSDWMHGGQHAGKWLKIEFYVQLNTPGQSDGVCKVWFNDVPVVDKSDVNMRSDSGTWDRLFFPANWTETKSGGFFPNTLYLDDVCIGNSLDDRTGFCAELRPNKPTQLPID